MAEMGLKQRVGLEGYIYPPGYDGVYFFFFQAEDGIRDLTVTGVQTCALPICVREAPYRRAVGDRARDVELAPCDPLRPERQHPGRVIAVGVGANPGRDVLHLAAQPAVVVAGPRVALVEHQHRVAS